MLRKHTAPNVPPNQRQAQRHLSPATGRVKRNLKDTLCNKNYKTPTLFAKLKFANESPNTTVTINLSPFSSVHDSVHGMGEPHSQPSALLPPGCRFYPSEELLLGYYLTNKNKDGDFYGGDLITELDLYHHDPFELPDMACFSYGYRGRKRHWYCYTVRVLKDGRRRRVKSGYWLRQGRVRDVLGTGGKLVLGTRTRFVFYVGDSPKNAIRTDWTLYEYALVDHLLASFVLCRVFVKPRHKNSPSVSCAEESVPAVRHIGIQHDEYVTPLVVEAKVCDDGSIDRKKEISVHPLRCTSELDDHQVTTAPVSVANLQCSAGHQGSEQGRFSGLPGGSAMFIEAMTSPQHLLSILEEDFIELDDLI